jgi:hypothetical protein
MPDDLKLVADATLYPSRTPYFVSADRKSAPLGAPSSQNPRLRSSYLLYRGSNTWHSNETDRLNKAVPLVLRRQIEKYLVEEGKQKGLSKGSAAGQAKVRAGMLSDTQMIQFVGNVMDPNAWAQVAAQVKTRTAAECEARWINREAPTVVTGHWTEKEKDKLVEAASLAGQGEIGWVEVSKRLGNGRTAIECFRTYKKVAEDRGLTVIDRTERKPQGDGILWGRRELQTAYRPGVKKYKFVPRNPDKPVRAIEQKPDLKRGIWTPEEDANLVKGMALYGTHWSLVQLLVPTRTDTQCRERYTSHLSPQAINKASFTPEEHQKLKMLQEAHPKKWSLISAAFGGKFNDDQCRKEWLRVFNPGGKQKTKKAAPKPSPEGTTPKKKKGKSTAEGATEANAEDPKSKPEPWTPEDVIRLQELHALHGDEWSKISIDFGGRFNKDRVRRKWKEHTFEQQQKEIEEEERTGIPRPVSTPTKGKKGKRGSRAKGSRKRARETDSEDEDGVVWEEDAGEDAVESPTLFVKRAKLSSRRHKPIPVKLRLPIGAVVDGGPAPASSGGRRPIIVKLVLPMEEPADMDET